MFGSQLITGGSSKTREAKLLEVILFVTGENILPDKLQTNPDVLIVEREEAKKSIGIAQTKKLIKFLDQKPLSMKVKFGVVLDAGSMTIDAQNSLLKTLEEPPSKSCILLLSETEEGILDTVKSRCKKIVVNESASILASKYSIDDLINAESSKRLKIAEEISKEEREDVIEVLKSFMVQTRARIGERPNEIAFNLKMLEKVISDLKKTNITTRLALEYLFLKLL